MAQEQNISTQLDNLLVTRNFAPEMLDRQGKPSESEDAKTFTFDYVSGSGKNYGTMVVILDSENDMKVFYGDNLGRAMEGDDKDEFFDFQQHLSKFARMHRWTYTAKDLNQLKHTMQGLAAIQEGLFEGYYGTRKISYAGEPTEARLMIKHNRTLGEADARFRYVESLFIETADSQRFRLPFKNLAGGRAMLEHVRQGGNPYDVRGVHIAEMVMEIATLSRFNRASASRMLEGTTKELVTEAQTYYKSLRENIKRMASPRGYSAYFETWHPATIDEQQDLVEDIKTLFIEQTLDTRIEAALPLLARIQQQGNAMKEAQIFENWINSLTEGTWSLPETPEQLNKLKELMATELIVGPDATNATEQLYDLIGDDILFDRLSELADRDPRANVWNDTEVMDRIRELGIETETQAPAGAEGDAAPIDTAAAPAPAPQQPVAEGQGATTYTVAYKDPTKPGKSHSTQVKATSAAEAKAAFQEWDTTNRFTYLGSRPDVDTVREGVAEAAELNTMLKYAGVPVAESRVLDESGETLTHILDRFKHEVAQFEQGADLDDNLYDALYDYYSDKGEIPYGIAKARTGDPYEWITNRLDQELGINESNSGMIMPEADPISTFEVMSGFAAPVAEGSCNSTMEGEYCPEHGLMECGMYEMGTVAGGMAPVVGEGNDDPINYNGAITGSYYEGKQDPLVRLKSLAKIKEGWKGELAGGTLGGVGGSVAGSALGALAGGPVGAAIGGVVGGAAGGTGGAMIGREMTKEEQLHEIAPLVAAGARAIIPLLAKVGPKLGRMASGAGKSGAEVAGKAATGIGRGTVDVAKSAAQSAAQNADKIGLGLGAYQAITDVANNTMGGVGEVYRDIGQAADAITQTVGNAIDGKTIAELAGTAVKYSIPIGILLAVLYGGKKLIDQLMSEDAADTGMALGGIAGGLTGGPLGAGAGVQAGGAIGSLVDANKKTFEGDAMLARIKSLALLK
jgi:hypothetical protein